MSEKIVPGFQISMKRLSMCEFEDSSEYCHFEVVNPFGFAAVCIDVLCTHLVQKAVVLKTGKMDGFEVFSRQQRLHLTPYSTYTNRLPDGATISLKVWWFYDTSDILLEAEYQEIHRTFCSSKPSLKLYSPYLQIESIDTANMEDDVLSVRPAMDPYLVHTLTGCFQEQKVMVRRTEISKAAKDN